MREKQILAEGIVEAVTNEREAYWTRILGEQGYKAKIAQIQATCNQMNVSNAQVLVEPIPTHSEALQHQRCEQLKADMAAQIVKGELMVQLKATGLHGLALLRACEEKMKEQDKGNGHDR